MWSHYRTLFEPADPARCTVSPPNWRLGLKGGGVKVEHSWRSAVWLTSTFIGLTLIGVPMTASGSAASASTPKAPSQAQIARCDKAATGHSNLTKTEVSSCAGFPSINHKCTSAPNVHVIKIGSNNIAIRLGHKPVKLGKSYTTTQLQATCGKPPKAKVLAAPSAPLVPTTTMPTTTLPPPPTTLPPVTTTTQPTVPSDLVGERLDVAENELSGQGISYTAVGGGVFGIVVKSDWIVCQTMPSGGQPVSGSVSLIVDHYSCT
jgi:hypothetical protein